MIARVALGRGHGAARVLAVVVHSLGQTVNVLHVVHHVGLEDLSADHLIWRE